MLGTCKGILWLCNDGDASLAISERELTMCRIYFHKKALSPPLRNADGTSSHYCNHIVEIPKTGVIHSTF